VIYEMGRIMKKATVSKSRDLKELKKKLKIPD
jgi:hypothetical protein